MQVNYAVIVQIPRSMRWVRHEPEPGIQALASAEKLLKDGRSVRIECDRGGAMAYLTVRQLREALG